MRWLFLSLMVLSSSAMSAVGSITEQAGPAVEIQRQKNKLNGNKGSGVEMNDTISTAGTKIGITFEDKTKVQLTEQSRLIIDDFVYDPRKSAGKLAMNVAQGTVRYASGAIAHNSRENVKLKTPTATIAVRGTDFSMTVDEIGRSLVILLPTCPPGTKKDDECWVGEIEVATDVGSVILNQAFQATMAASANQMPSEPKILDVNENMINNNLIISPPKTPPVSSARAVEDNKSNWLDKELLEYKELARDFLGEDQLKYSELDVNRLDFEFLDNLLDLATAALNQDQLDVDPVLPNIKNYPWIPKVYNDENIFLYSERPPHIASIKVARDTTGVANIIQDGVEANVLLNGGGTSVVFNIRQTQ